MNGLLSLAGFPMQHEDTVRPVTPADLAVLPVRRAVGRPSATAMRRLAAQSHVPPCRSLGAPANASKS